MTYIFDFDGTLVDSMPTFAQAMIQIFEREGLPYPDDFVKIITPLGYKGTAQYAIQCGYKKDVETFVADTSAITTPAYINTIPLKKDVYEALLRLHSAGHSLNILTASPHTVLDPCLKRVGVYDLFDNVWSCEDFGLTKADTLLYEKVAQALHQTLRDCIFLDDNINSVSTAKKAGMTAVAVYDASSDDMIEEMKAVADRYVYSFAEL